ncbi:UDP-4-amino-4,6-dideoxy-N-acetyl-beta-L-altrosamine N-acetyltransferase [Rubinisphaera margarita]|uniref:UDP-4-amino-4, 6-dideoxy-N-acetyl-beta-L-altrosamine N-acetyltransferase n=1 Tax=Rubinisphaera margarita TaxID=2909586 RepID=UPI001EE7CCF4|nr:UDP-4-amino-4,6-dideoxy-N-acetyl-beta-L-altrosamine N-acetyltransferase [Rubinisphaera margarita]MCG6157322.1 UDP-4-amino-4,6-dideoxy-N-acetyl-beta-L-altrosamine N-acetyltransferase [Rubinisphaera margarita]
MNEPKPIHLIPIVSLEVEDQMKVRELRNEAEVRRWMFTDHEISVNEHLLWISRLKKDDSQIVFAVLNDDRQPLGVISVTKIDRANLRAERAYYLTASARGGLGSAIEYHFLNFIFETLQIEKLNCEVLEGNEVSLNMHHKFLFVDEGFRRSEIVKHGERLGVHFVGLTRDEWLAERDTVLERSREKIERFQVRIEWNGEGENGVVPKAIDQIEAARARNNVNWMNIMRLALEKSPDIAVPIVSEIKKIDREISGLTEKLEEENS